MTLIEIGNKKNTFLDVDEFIFKSKLGLMKKIVNLLAWGGQLEVDESCLEILCLLSLGRVEIKHVLTRLINTAANIELNVPHHYYTIKSNLLL